MSGQESQRWRQRQSAICMQKCMSAVSRGHDDQAVVLETAAEASHSTHRGCTGLNCFSGLCSTRYCVFSRPGRARTVSPAIPSPSCGRAKTRPDKGDPVLYPSPSVWVLRLQTKCLRPQTPSMRQPFVTKCFATVTNGFSLSHSSTPLMECDFTRLLFCCGPWTAHATYQCLAHYIWTISLENVTYGGSGIDEESVLAFTSQQHLEMWM